MSLYRHGQAARWNFREEYYSKEKVPPTPRNLAVGERRCPSINRRDSGDRDLVCVRSTDAVAADRSFESVGSRISYKTGRRLQQIFLISTKEIFASEISSFFSCGKRTAWPTRALIVVLFENTGQATIKV